MENLAKILPKGHIVNLWHSDLVYRAKTAEELDYARTGKAEIYGVPRGGVYAAYIIAGARPHLAIVENPENADFIVDDVIDSGRTREEYRKLFPEKSFFALVDKKGRDDSWAGVWISFPWERQNKEESVEDNIVRILQFIGEDVSQEDLLETPKRVVASFKELYSGYSQNPCELMKTFEGERYDELVLLKDIELFSMCRHHMLPFYGRAHVGYIPKVGGRIVGLSKLARLVEVYARRLQTQERITKQVTDALNKCLEPLGAACVIEAKHLCVACRGIAKQHSKMVTSSMTGVFREKPEARAEFMALIKDGSDW